MYIVVHSTIRISALHGYLFPMNVNQLHHIIKIAKQVSTISKKAKERR